MTDDPDDALPAAPRDSDEKLRWHVRGMRRVWKAFGVPFICPEPGCRRARRCTGLTMGDDRRMPPCTVQYREELRFLTFGPHSVPKVIWEPDTLPPARGPGEEAWLRRLCGQAGATRRTSDKVPVTVLQTLYGYDAGALDRLTRRRGMPSPGCWEYDPDLFARYMAAGDWRDPRWISPPPPRFTQGGPGSSRTHRPWSWSDP